MAKVIPLCPLAANGTKQVPPPPFPWLDGPGHLVAALSSTIHGLLVPGSDPDLTHGAGRPEIKSIQAENTGAICRLQIDLFWPSQGPGRILRLFPEGRISDWVG